MTLMRKMVLTVMSKIPVDGRCNFIWNELVELMDLTPLILVNLIMPFTGRIFVKFLVFENQEDNLF